MVLAWIRHTAARLAAGQRLEYLAPIFVRMPASAPAVRELLGCLLHELVLRYGMIDDPDIVAFAEWLRASSHPLGALPLRRLDAEAFVELPRYFVGGEARGRSFGQSDRTGASRAAARPGPRHHRRGRTEDLRGGVELAEEPGGPW